MEAGAMDSRFTLDMADLSNLKRQAAENSAQAVRDVAEQFEALFLQTMLQSMRDTIPESGLLDSQHSRFYEDLMDQQWSSELAGKGLGLAEQLTAQLSSYVEESR